MMVMKMMWALGESRLVWPTCSPGSHVIKDNRLWLSAVLLTTRGY